ncbi:immunoglobulin J chain isoform X1 [Lagenorhynchus albirostris]|uniref:immunoglobulin J chain isoform X1 n=1 Tax=Tursiops truncatus TaxID=9739 RepID=UPI000951E406|nr:immunoglobulin J chain isoform X1 [Tursiops truncatus]XP_060003224.1 immunoglobulin J chain isoform X1 [Lagenorhynchus albirostris]
MDFRSHEFQFQYLHCIHVETKTWEGYISKSSTETWAQDEDERTVLVDNKCKCARITSRIIPSAEDPSQDIVERNIRIIVPLNSRENISDPTSPLRTKFVYHLSDLCKKCDLTEVELDNQVVTATQSNICDEDIETCYTYDRNKCYTNRVPLTYGGKTKMVETALTPDSCYPD